MAKYTSGRQKNLKIGISSYSENLTSLEVIGKVGIGTTNPTRTLDVNGDIRIRGGLYDVNNQSGTSGQLLVSTETGVDWQDAGSISDIQTIINTSLTGIGISEDGVGIGTTFTRINFIGPGVTASANGTSVNVTVVDYVSNAGVSTSVIGGIGSITQLQVTGVSTFTNGPILVGTATSTGTASQRLQVDGGAYVSGNLGVGNNNGEGIKLFVSQGAPAANRPVALITDDGTIPTMTSGATLRISNDGSGNSFAGLEIESGAGRLVFTNAGNLGIGTTNPQAQLHITGQFQSTQANSTTTGGGQIYLNGATGNRIDFNTNGVAAPAFTTRSAGTKLVLYPSVSGSAVDYGFGIESGTLWSSVPEFVSTYKFRWYGGTTQLADLKGTGEFLLGSSTLTGTASQRLQVDGGAYVSGNLGIGTTNPTSTLTVSGDANISGVVTATSFSGSGTNLTGIVTSIVAGTNITVSGSTGQVTVNSTASGGGAALDILEVMLFA